MGLTREQKRKIEANIQTLDYLKGTGIISEYRKQLANEFFVFISSGGVGRIALAELKKSIMNQVNHDDIEKQTMFLAVETAHQEIDEAIEKGEFETIETLKVPCTGAHNSIKPDRILPQMEEWVHPDLWSVTGGNNRVSREFNGTGAGARRQCGRVLFSQSAVQTELYNKLSRIPSLLAKKQGIRKINVFFLCGIAGGTGSGTIIDLAYLSRHFINDIVGTMADTVVYSAYLFMPSACSDKIEEPMKRESGNRNAYAALKEIDYYMTIAERNEYFKMNYGTSLARDVNIGDNIFDFCTLVEGFGDGGNFFERKAETARKIVADSILNIICSNSEKVINGENMFLVDSFLSNRTIQANTRIASMSDNVWPRDVNYHYSVIGYSSCVVPIDLLTVYVTKKIFDEVYRKFADASKADEDAAADFLDACGLNVADLEKVWKTISRRALLSDIQKQADEEFKDYGPFYMVNLLNEAKKLIEDEPREYLHLAQKKLNGFGANKDKWGRIIQCYNAVTDYFGKANNELYEVYTCAVKTLKELIEDNAKLLTDTQEYKNQFGKSFCWSPIDLTPGNQATEAVAQYLDSIFDADSVRRSAQAFVERLCDQKDAWTQLNAPDGQLAGKFDVAGQVREFIKTELSSCINTKLEEFIVKAYSGEANAEVYEADPETGANKYSMKTRQAAEEVFGRLNREASALASTRDFLLEDCYSNNYLTVPDNCQYFYDAICDIAADYHGTTVYKTSAIDKIVLCRRYAGVPAWALHWTKGAEDIYERIDNATEVGLHMDQGSNGTNWRELPNLYPAKLWDADMRERRVREAAISRDIQDHMRTAYELNALTENPLQKEYYDIVLLKEEKSPEKLLQTAELDPKKKYSMKEVLDILVEKNVLERFTINYTNQIMTTIDRFTDDELKEFRFQLACRTIRRFHEKYRLLPETVKVLTELCKLVDERVVADESIITLFLKALKWDVVVYNGVRNKWYLSVNDDEELRKLDTKLEKICAHYYGFQAFAGLDQDTLEEVSDKAAELEEEAKDEEIVEADEKMVKLKKSLQMLREAKKKGISPWPADSVFKSGNESDWPMAKEDFVEKVGNEVEAKAIRDFYSDLISNI